jgi:hypothetical protein
MGAFTRQELDDAFAVYQQGSEKAAASGDWATWAEQFTDDARYLEHAYGTFVGRDAIRGWITKTMAVFPGSCMSSFPIEWYVADDSRGWIVCEIWNRMMDIGDDELHQASNLTVLHYAGDGLWSYEEDVYNPADFMKMLQRWRRSAEEHDALPDEARTWFAAFGG